MTTKTKKNEKGDKLENAVVGVTNLILAGGVGAVMKSVIRNAVPKASELSKPTAALFFIGELAISGAITDLVATKYEAKIRTYFKRMRDLSKVVEEIKKDVADGENKAST